MKGKVAKLEKIKLLIYAIVIIIFIVFVKNGISSLRGASKIFVVEEGNLKFEENADGYILRDEKILIGNNSKNGMVQIVSEGERVSKGGQVFRYYSNGEENILNQISELDNQINGLIENANLTFLSSDVTLLEKNIKNTLNLMYSANDLEIIKERITEIDNYMSKKTKITGNLTPENSQIKKLIEERSKLEESLVTSSEIMYAPVSGLVSYKVDGNEEKLGVNNLSYLSTEYLENIDADIGSTISTNTECGKIVNNFYCYIACSIDSEKAMNCQVGDTLKLRILNGDEINAEIIHITEEDEKRVIVFKIENDIDKLIEYRKISLDIIWWNYSGLKIRNSALKEENDISYVEQSKAGYTSKIYVKVLRQNESYSIVENYTDEELLELGIDEEYVENRSKISRYDEILLH